MTRRFKRKNKRSKSFRAGLIEQYKFRERVEKEEKARKYVLNLSNHELNNEEVLLLSKGLKFIPTPKTKNAKNQIMLSFNEFARKLRCKYHFGGQEKTNNLHPFRIKSGFEPDRGCENLEKYIELTKLELSSIQMRQTHDNLSLRERHAIKQLKSLKDVVIKKADKSNTIVILDKEMYKREGEKMLNSPHYEEVEQPNLHEIDNAIMKIIGEMKMNSMFDKETIKYLTSGQTYRVGRLYLLPKIHKLNEQLITNVRHGACNELPIMPPGRPIISQIGTPAERIGHYCDYFLVPIVRMQNTYIKDTSDFINKIESLKLNPDCLLITYDVTSMYTNMTFDELLNAVGRSYNEHTLQSQLELNCPTKQNMLDLLKIILENNYFEFNGKHYRQRIGAAMGAVPSPEICDIRMYEITNAMMSQFQYREKIAFHGRYRDDGFIIYNGTLQEANHLFEIGNAIHDLLKFTYEISETEMTFLDTTVFKGNRFSTQNVLDIKTHMKKTNNFQYLHRESAHPTSVFKGFIKGECYRLLRNTSDNSVLDSALQSFNDKLMLRGYCETETIPIIQEVKHKNRKDLLKPKSAKQRKEKHILVTKFDPRIKGIKKRLMKNWKLISEDSLLKTIFQSAPMIAYKKHQNLGDILTSSIVY